jgi:tetratricopeptide (TPR) repeat protein
MGFREEDLQAELTRLSELRFSYPQTAREECFTLLRSAIEEVENGRGSLHHICDWISLQGAIEVVLNHSALAASYLRRAFSIAKLLNEPAREASLLQMCSYLIANHGNYDAAITLEEQACHLYVLSKDLCGIGKTLLDRGNMYFYQGEYATSCQYYDSALHYLPKQMWTHRFQAFQCLGFVNLQLKNLEHAQSYADLAAKEHKTRDGPNWWKLMWLRGEIALNQDDMSFAEAMFRQICDVFLAQEDHIDAALVSLRLAKVLLMSGKTEEMQQVCLGMMVLMDPLKLENEIAGSTIHEFLKLALVGKVTVDSLDRAYEDIQLVTEKRNLASKTA